jgi:hypothetical protein
MRPYLEKNPSQKKRLVEWLKVKALSSNRSTGKKKNLAWWCMCVISAMWGIAVQASLGKKK